LHLLLAVDFCLTSEDLLGVDQDPRRLHLL